MKSTIGVVTHTNGCSEVFATSMCYGTKDINARTIVIYGHTRIGSR